MRYEYRITKYDPKFRTPAGVYTREEWTFFAQVGTVVAGRRVSMQDYLRTETAYLGAIKAAAMCN